MAETPRVNRGRDVEDNQRINASDINNRRSGGAQRRHEENLHGTYGGEVDVARSKYGFQQQQEDLKIFANPQDREVLKEMNDADLVHKALSSQDCLAYMCDELPGKIGSGDLKEFLIRTRLNGKPLLDPVRMDEIENETVHKDREKKRRCLAEMRKEQGEQLNPRILLNLAHSFYMRLLYDELCKSFIAYLKSRLSNSYQ